MHNFNRLRKPSDSESYQNLTVLEDYMDSICYSHWVPAAALVGNIVLGNLNSVAIGEFPNALDTLGYYTFKKPTQWDNGLVGIKIHYTGDASGGNVARILYSISPIDSLETIPAAPLDSVVLIAPTTADVYNIYDGMNVSISNLYLLNENDRSLSLAFKRVGGAVTDTYTHTFKLIGIDILYKENSSPSTKRLNINDRTR